ncbi:MAG: hypothetical protein H7Z16_15040 [Pyrinomonadaceae bacterium]|nr:hypothetical protein [Pyrinomonadaceae bacterium]
MGAIELTAIKPALGILHKAPAQVNANGTSVARFFLQENWQLPASSLLRYYFAANHQFPGEENDFQHG